MDQAAPGAEIRPFNISVQQESLDETSRAGGAAPNVPVIVDLFVSE
jgi:hypothetical protein